MSDNILNTAQTGGGSVTLTMVPDREEMARRVDAVCEKLRMATYSPRVKKAIQMYRDGVLVKIISHETGLHETQICQIARDAGVKMRRPWLCQ